MFEGTKATIQKEIDKLSSKLYHDVVDKLLDTELKTMLAAERRGQQISPVFIAVIRSHKARSILKSLRAERADEFWSGSIADSSTRSAASTFPKEANPEPGSPPQLLFMISMLLATSNCVRNLFATTGSVESQQVANATRFVSV
jgi:hypothetical protein